MKDMRPTITNRIRLAGLFFAVAFALVGAGHRSTDAGEAGTAFGRGNLVRLHVLANSDSPADQRVKLQVRDDLLHDSHELFRGVTDPLRAREVVRRNLGTFRRIAERRLRAEGFAYPVKVEFGVYPFPERTYGAITLPEGRYTALRVVLGEGRGHNWWCVLFPPLCFLEMDSELARERVKLLRPADGRRVAVRFKLGLPSGPARPVPLSVLTSASWR